MFMSALSELLLNSLMPVKKHVGETLQKSATSLKQSILAVQVVFVTVVEKFH